MDNPFGTTGFLAGGFTFAQPNGVNVSAPLEFWVAAIMSILTPAQQAEVLSRVDKIKANEMQVMSTDGFPYRVSTLGG